MHGSSTGHIRITVSVPSCLAFSNSHTAPRLSDALLTTPNLWITTPPLHLLSLQPNHHSTTPKNGSPLTHPSHSHPRPRQPLQTLRALPLHSPPRPEPHPANPLPLPPPLLPRHPNSNPTLHPPPLPPSRALPHHPHRTPNNAPNPHHQIALHRRGTHPPPPAPLGGVDVAVYAEWGWCCGGGFCALSGGGEADIPLCYRYAWGFLHRDV